MQDDDIGRVIDFDDTQPLERTPDERSSGEFIVDPFHSGTNEGGAHGRPVAPTPAPDPGARSAAPLSSQDEVSITVPVVLTRSQMRKTIPVKVTLEIQWVDEEM